MDLVYGLKYLEEPEDAKDCVLSIYEELIPNLQKHEVAIRILKSQKWKLNDPGSKAKATIDF